MNSEQSELTSSTIFGTASNKGGMETRGGRLVGAWQGDEFSTFKAENGLALKWG
jgi:hypothetical protein